MTTSKYSIKHIESFKFDNAEPVFYLRQRSPSGQAWLWFKPMFKDEGDPYYGFELIVDQQRIAELEAQFLMALAAGNME